MTDLDFLRHVAVFNGLNDSQLTAIENHCREIEFRHNEKLISEGDDAACLWIVKEGRVDLRFDLPHRPTSAKNTISSISESMSFGWSSLVAPHKYRLAAYRTLRPVLWSCRIWWKSLDSGFASCRISHQKLPMPA